MRRDAAVITEGSMVMYEVVWSGGDVLGSS